MARWRAARFAVLPAVALMLALSLPGPAIGATLQPGDDPAASPVWQKVRASLFEGRAVQPAPAGWLTLDVPGRAIDAAVVPLAIRATLPAGQQVARLVLVIDANPSPISGLFRFPAQPARAEVQTRVRVDAYSWVRAIVETADGRLYGTTKFVKASGGCSAPAGADAAAALAALGRMNLRVDGNPDGPDPVTMQLAISHPNHSGMAMDQATRQFTPSHFVRTVQVSVSGRPVFEADVDFSISENPNFRFPVAVPLPARGVVHVSVVDSQGRQFELDQPLAAGPAPVQ